MSSHFDSEELGDVGGVVGAVVVLAVDVGLGFAGWGELGAEEDGTASAAFADQVDGAL